MRIIRNEKQKDNLAKVFWDIGKVIIVILVISPLAKPEIDVMDIYGGVLISFFLWLIGYLIDGIKINK